MKNNDLILESCKRMIDYGCYNEHIAKYYKQLIGSDIESQFSEEEICDKHKIKNLDELFVISKFMKTLVYLSVTAILELFLYLIGLFSIEIHTICAVTILALFVISCTFIITFYCTKIGRLVLKYLPIRLNDSMSEVDVDYYVTNGYAKVVKEKR